MIRNKCLRMEAFKKWKVIVAVNGTESMEGQFTSLFEPTAVVQRELRFVQGHTASSRMIKAAEEVLRMNAALSLLHDIRFRNNLSTCHFYTPQYQTPYRRK